MHGYSEDYRNERRDEKAHHDRLLEQDAAAYTAEEKAREEREALLCADGECPLCQDIDAEGWAMDMAVDQMKDER